MRTREAILDVLKQHLGDALEASRLKVAADVRGILNAYDLSIWEREIVLARGSSTRFGLGEEI